MRRTVVGLMLAVGLLALTACGNKGPLVRPSAQPPKAAPARVASTAPGAASVSASPSPPAVAASTRPAP